MFVLWVKKSAALVPVKYSALEGVDVTDFDDEDEDEHGYDAGKSDCEGFLQGVSEVLCLAEGNRPWIHEDDFDVEEDEDHCDDIKLHRESGSGSYERILTAFIRLILGDRGEGSFADEEGEYNHSDGDRKAGCDLNQNGKVLAHVGFKERGLPSRWQV